MPARDLRRRQLQGDAGRQDAAGPARASRGRRLPRARRSRQRWTASPAAPGRSFSLLPPDNAIRQLRQGRAARARPHRVGEPAAAVGPLRAGLSADVTVYTE